MRSKLIFVPICLSLSCAKPSFHVAILSEKGYDDMFSIGTTISVYLAFLSGISFDQSDGAL